MQTLSDLLTIVIPVKNEEKNLPACLENVREFRHVVLVDSGSNDKTREIFGEMALRTARVSPERSELRRRLNAGCAVPTEGEGRC